MGHGELYYSGWGVLLDLFLHIIIGIVLWLRLFGNCVTNLSPCFTSFLLAFIVVVTVVHSGTVSSTNTSAALPPRPTATSATLPSGEICKHNLGQHMQAQIFVVFTLCYISLVVLWYYVTLSVVIHNGMARQGKEYRFSLENKLHKITITWRSLNFGTTSLEFQSTTPVLLEAPSNFTQIKFDFH